MSLNIAARALTTNQSVLQVIGHNISNANTVGYTRQSVSLNSVPGQQVGNGYFGKGVELVAVKRSYDAFLTKQANTTATVAAGDALRYEKMQQIESLFPLGEGSLGTQLNNALNSWVDVLSSPTDSTARGVVISRSDELAARIRDTSSRLQEIGDAARLQSAEVVKTINLLATQVADLNEKISRAQAGGAAPNDLLDQRDQVLSDLNKKVHVSTINADDGTVTVFVAGSLPLVMGNKAASLKVGRSALDDQRQTVSFVQNGSTFDIQDDFLSGELKGLQSFVNNDLTQTQSQLGRMALAMATQLNQQQHSGLNQLGNAGADLFTLPALQGYAAGTNTGNASLSMTVSDGTALGGSDYEVTFTTASEVTIRRLSDGVLVAGSPAAVPLPLTFEGLTLTQASGAASAGDRFLLRPGADTAKTIAVALSSPADLAVSSSVMLTPGAGNSTGLTIEQAVQTQSPASATLPINVSFDASGQISVDSGATYQAFTPGKPIDVGGYRITLRGVPAPTDTFTLDAMPAGAVKFNAGNAQAVLALRDQVSFDGTTTLADGYVPVFSSVASTLSETKFSAQFSTAQAAAAETQRANTAGVNLDEEAALLIQYQQAYQASAKYMGTVQSLFDTLMSAFR